MGDGGKRDCFYQCPTEFGMTMVEQYVGEIGPFQIVGVFGFLVYLLAFGGVQFGVLNGNGAVYSLYNVIAAVLVSVSLIAEFNLSSALIQGSWIVIGLIGLARRSSVWPERRSGTDDGGLTQ